MTECEAAQYRCEELEGVVFGQTFDYDENDPFSCPAPFDNEPDGNPEIPTDVAGELDCVTLRDWIVGDPDKDGFFQESMNEVPDPCQQNFNADDTDNDNDGLADGLGGCDPEPDSPAASELDCDLNGDGVVDRADVAESIFEATGQAAFFPNDPGSDRRDRDPDGAGAALPDTRISVFDSALCRIDCTATNCR
jgi:hypothetical protein